MSGAGPDGGLLAAAHQHHLRLIDLATELANLKGQRKQIFALAFSPDSRTLASASADGTVRLWDVEVVLRAARRRHR